MDKISKEKQSSLQTPIDPKDIMAVERSVTALIGLSISFIVLGFIVEKFQLFLLLMSEESKTKAIKALPQFQNINFYTYLGIIITTAGMLLALYTYFYYKKWGAHLQRGKYDTDKTIFRVLAFFIAGVGFLLILSMLVFR